MTRKHRSIHRVLWLILALAIGVGFAMALYLRPPVALEALQATESRR